MKIRTIAAGFVALLAVTSAQAQTGWQTFADVAGYGLPFLALGYTAAQNDLDKGGWQLAYTGATALVLTEGLKYGVNAKRPNGGDKGFPSGHTSSAFFAAGYLEDRYGWEVGIPAHLLAGLVGYSRIHTKDHNFGQVLAGAVVGEVTAYVFTSRIDDSVTFVPWADASGGGVGLAMIAKF
jgi:membrane-associated phospholipid phosphatase